MSSPPTKAILAAVAGQAYQIPFGGQMVFEYAQDVADAFVAAARTPVRGAHALNLGGASGTLSELVAGIVEEIPEAEGRITIAPTVIEAPTSVDESSFQTVIGRCDWRSLRQGVSATVRSFQAVLGTERLDVARGLGGEDALPPAFRPPLAE
jgi:nucleoside-diphosphate-sugar epimerase